MCDFVKGLLPSGDIIFIYLEKNIYTHTICNSTEISTSHPYIVVPVCHQPSLINVISLELSYVYSASIKLLLDQNESGGKRRELLIVFF